MAMTQRIQPILHPVRIRDLCPTQMTVGLREVATKREEWRNRPRDSADKYLGSHMIPAVIGPGGAPWIIDHHHFALALHEEGADEVMVSVVAKLDMLSKKRFFAFMDSHNWLHPYDTKGKRRDLDELPARLSDLADDPYRSLAGEVRRAGGYAKSPTPYTEFLWADFFRDRIKPSRLDDHFSKAVADAVPMARSHEAHYLPGWSGIDNSD
jgi:hypothetical protein